LGGAVGIGTPGANYPLDVQTTIETIANFQSTNSFPSFRVSSTGEQAGRHPLISFRDGTTQVGTFGVDIDKSILTFGVNSIHDDYLVIDNSGKIGIGDNTPSFTLEVNGTAGKTGGGVWSTPSDRRLKTNIKSYTDGLDAILKIRPVTFNYNGKLDLSTDKEYVGVIAQEIKEIAPYTIEEKDFAVKGEKPELYYSYDGSALTYMLINAVKEQQSQIEEQKEEIERLKNELNNLDLLKTEVAELKALIMQKKNSSI
jgi:hypothetical protein